LEYRLQMLAKDEEIKFFETVWKTARMRGVLQLVADKAGWGKALPAGGIGGLLVLGVLAAMLRASWRSRC